jgi:hypothetical protein
VKAIGMMFKPEMVRAILAGRKTQTRRLLKPQPPTPEQFPGSTFSLDRAVADGAKMYSQNQYAGLPKHPTKWELIGSVGVAAKAEFPKFYTVRLAVGDRIYVRETFQISGGHHKPYFLADDDGTVHKAWKPAIHMPRKFSRITLTVTDVRVQRLQEITDEDAIAEGIYAHHSDELGHDVYSFERKGDPAGPKSRVHQPAGWDTAARAYGALWRKINGEDSWDLNPWVVAYTFTVEKKNIDA